MLLFHCHIPIVLVLAMNATVPLPFEHSHTRGSRVCNRPAILTTLIKSLLYLLLVYISMSRTLLEVFSQDILLSTATSATIGDPQLYLHSSATATAT